MNSYDVKRLALMNAILVEIEGMKAYNQHRLSLGQSIGYNEDHFFEKAEELRILASKHDEQL